MLTLVKFVHATEKIIEVSQIHMITASVRPFPKCR